MTDVRQAIDCDQRGQRPFQPLAPTNNMLLTVLSGVMNAPQEGIPDWKVAVVSVTPKLSDPGALKRKHVLVDRRIVASRPPRAT
jgi:hypothetical protein